MHRTTGTGSKAWTAEVLVGGAQSQGNLGAGLG